MELTHLVVGARRCFYNLRALAKADVDKLPLVFFADAFKYSRGSD